MAGLGIYQRKGFVDGNLHVRECAQARALAHVCKWHVWHKCAHACARALPAAKGCMRKLLALKSIAAPLAPFFHDGFSVDPPLYTPLTPPPPFPFPSPSSYPYFPSHASPTRPAHPPTYIQQRTLSLPSASQLKISPER